MEDYDTLPDFVDLDITEDVVEQVARRLSGSAGPGGSDAQAIQHWLLRFGGASGELRRAVAGLVEWMANDFPPWAAYRALKAGRLIALDKCPGVRPVGIGEVWNRLNAKCVLLVSLDEAKEACGVDQLCSGLEAGIEGAIHAMRLLWQSHSAEEEWGFLLVDARNAFNEGNRMVMLWTVRHKWPSGARFTFNCYRHWSALVVRFPQGHAYTIFSREGVTQGDPLAMVAYGLLLLPLIRDLKRELPDVNQPWYADDSGAGGNFAGIRSYFERLQEKGPRRGYFPEPSKSILVVQEHNRAAAEIAFKDLGFTIVTGTRYLGGYIGSAEDQSEWVNSKTSDWTAAVGELSQVAERFPQSAYAGLQKSLQQEWQFLQRVTAGLGKEFRGVEDALTTKFLPALFGITETDNPLRQLACLPVKQSGLAIPDPTTTADENWTTSTFLPATFTRSRKLGQILIETLRDVVLLALSDADSVIQRMHNPINRAFTSRSINLFFACQFDSSDRSSKDKYWRYEFSPGVLTAFFDRIVQRVPDLEIFHRMQKKFVIVLDFNWLGESRVVVVHKANFLDAGIFQSFALRKIREILLRSFHKNSERVSALLQIRVVDFMF
jgi:hypothetical protein